MKYFFQHIISLIFLSGTYANAQVPDEMGLPQSNIVEENFYAALKQKAIDNHDKAIDYLLENLKLEPHNPVFHNQLGKSYLASKNYIQAEKSFQKAIDLDVKQKWYWADLYDVYYKSKEVKKAIPIVQKLIEFDKDYQDDLVSLYIHTKENDKALFLIESMEKQGKISVAMERYKLQLITESSFTKKVKNDYAQNIKNNPTDESGYTGIIVNYISNNQYDKAFEVIEELSKKIPNSDWSNVYNFKKALKSNDYQNTYTSLTKLINSSIITDLIKHRCFNEFLIYVNLSDTHLNDLEVIVDYFNDQELVNVPKEVGVFFYNKKKFSFAQKYLKKGIEIDKKDIIAITLYIQTYLDINNLQSVEDLAKYYLDYFPAEARLYYFLGLAQQGLNEPKKAIKNLEEALAYLTNDSQLEANIYIQLGESYNKLGDQKQKEKYFIKANQILNK